MCTHVLQCFFCFLQMAHRIRTSDPAVILHKARFQFDRAMHHHTPLRIMLCCVYTCLPSSWFLNMGADAWPVLENGIHLLLCNLNEANWISCKSTLPSFLLFYLLSIFSSLFPSFPLSSFLPFIFSSFDHIVFLSY